MSKKPSILFLCHRIPYPPNKGDKIRSYNLLLWLAQRYEVSLGAFVDNDADWAHTAHLDDLCAHTCFLPMPAGVSKALKAAGAVLRRRAISVELYRAADMMQWVTSIVTTHKPDHVLVFSSAMGLYLDALPDTRPQVLVDFVDVDSQKWQQYSQEKSWPFSWLFRREATRLLEHDRKLANAADRSFFVSEKEAELFRLLVPTARDKVFALANGVDTEFFDPDAELISPYAEQGISLVFTGAMDYWPNVDAVEWFSHKVMPLLNAAAVHATLYIVGSNPAAAVRRLHGGNIVVTGTVDDIRPYIGAADIIVAPLRVARGIQNKVLEAMAMRRVVVTTPSGAEGIEATSGVHYWVLEEPQEFADAIAAIAVAPDPAMGVAAREFVLERFSWTNCLAVLARHLDAPAASQ